ncbi:CHAD domain-containing protein [Spongiibacter nanhainus]|uniref:CHAD domain-containing protein n=1 Tax=Spongiibacter nanhainus TaxID=2794344 RepID=A0A7T4UNT9_9GAMM|nr:CHAD domain-containing protein [Spongiibacter nanhainus]QQD16953.1 CHAD domain-containing protein [Spongiibacter nanhainus]
MEQHWLADEPIAPNHLAALLGDDFCGDWEPPAETRIEVLDTFGWSIWHSGALLCRSSNKTLTLYSHNGSVQAWTEAPRSARFWWQLPEGELRDTLKPVTELWSFNPVASFYQRRQTVNIRNEDGKTVARLQHTTCSTSHKAHCSLVALQGYKHSFSRISRRLAEAETIAVSPLAEHAWLTACATPRKIDKLPHFGIDAQQSAESAVRQMIRAMLEQARLFEPGILEDTDTEFLHQYRVSIRKARSLVTLMGKVLSLDAKTTLKQCFKQLVGPTGELRDMDVFLLAKDHYTALLPGGFEAGLDELFAEASKDRRRALKRVRKWMRSERYQQVINDLDTTLSSPAQLQSKKAAKPVATLLEKNAHKSFQRIKSLGSSIDKYTPDNEIHALRIECKKMRYLMEYFIEILPEKPTMKFVKSLKKLQDVLGDFNDYAVQQNFLRQYTDSHTSSAALSAATGGMIAVLHQLHLQARQQVEAAFAGFNSAEVESTFSAIFAGETRGQEK